MFSLATFSSCLNELSPEFRTMHSARNCLQHSVPCYMAFPCSPHAVHSTMPCFMPISITLESHHNKGTTSGFVDPPRSAGCIWRRTTCTTNTKLNGGEVNTDPRANRFIRLRSQSKNMIWDTHRSPLYMPSKFKCDFHCTSWSCARHALAPSEKEILLFLLFTFPLHHTFTNFILLCECFSQFQKYAMLLLLLSYLSVLR